MAFKTYVSSFFRIKKNSETVERTHRTHVIHVTRVIQHHSAETGRLESRDETGFILLTNHSVVLERSELFESPAGARTQLGAAVVADDPGEHGVLGEVAAAAVGQRVEVQQVLVVGQEAALPLQRVALGRALRHVVLCGDRGTGRVTPRSVRAGHGHSASDGPTGACSVDPSTHC